MASRKEENLKQRWYTFYNLASLILSLILPAAAFVVLQVFYPPVTLLDVLGRFLLALGAAVGIWISRQVVSSQQKLWRLYLEKLPSVILLIFTGILLQIGTVIMGIWITSVGLLDMWLAYSPIYVLMLYIVTIPSVPYFHLYLSRKLFDAARQIDKLRSDLTYQSRVDSRIFDLLLFSAAVIPAVVWLVTGAGKTSDSRFVALMVVVFALAGRLGFKFSRVGKYSDINDLMWGWIDGEYPRRAWGYIISVFMIGVFPATAIPILLSSVGTGFIFIALTLAILAFGVRTITIVIVLLTHIVLIIRNDMKKKMKTA